MKTGLFSLLNNLSISLDLYYMTIVEKPKRFLSLSKKPFSDLLQSTVRNKEALIMTGHSKSVNSVVISSDNSKTISGSWDNTIKVSGRLV